MPVMSAPIQMTSYTPAPDESRSAKIIVSAPAVKQTPDKGNKRPIPM